MDDLVTSDNVFDDVSEIARDQMARGKPFMETLSKALDVQADYNNWVQGKPANPELDDKVEECLNIWNDREHGKKAKRNDLIAILRKNQRRNNCQALILKLEESTGANATPPTNRGAMGASVNSSSTSGGNEDWSKLEVFMTPENLMGCKIMDTTWTTLAQHLGIDVLQKYQMYANNFPGMTQPPNIKLLYLLGIWKASQTDLQRPISNFLATLEDGQKKSGSDSLNNLIAKIKDTVLEEKNVSRPFVNNIGEQNEASFGNEDEDMEEIRGLKLTAAFKGLGLKGRRHLEDEGQQMDEVDGGSQIKVNLAICIFNTYENHQAADDGWPSLPGANQDRMTITRMLENDYNMEEMTNQDDIEDCVIKIMRQWQHVKIHRLHFHFSGHGIFNQTVQTNDSQYDEVDSRTPFGECLLGNNGDQGLCSVLSIQKLLTQFHTDVITLTLDCCRTLDRPQTRQRVKLAKLPVISNEDWLRIATVYSSCKTRPAYDQTSFSNELSKVISSTKRGRIQINKIAKLVNESWRKNGINYQYCNIERIEGGKFDWDKLYWPL